MKKWYIQVIDTFNHLDLSQTVEGTFEDAIEEYEHLESIYKDNMDIIVFYPKEV